MRFLVLAWVLCVVGAVKHELFKTCGQSGFCHRQRHYASHVRGPKYAVDVDSLRLGDDVVEGHLTKKNTEAIFPFRLTVVADSLRVTIDEDRSHVPQPNPLVRTERYNETASWAFAEGVENGHLNARVDGKTLVVEYGKGSRAEIDTTTFAMEVFLDGESVVKVNSANSMNIEHWREPEDSLYPEESDYDMFSDSFKDSSDDSMPLGPESIGLDFYFEDAHHLYGLPEHADSFRLRDTSGSEPYRLFNVDIFEYEAYSTMPMYGSIPLVVAPSSMAASGVFWINSADTWADIGYDDDGARTHFISENGIVDFVIFASKKMSEVHQHYGEITGNSAQPPLFALGNHQCRWNYNDEADVLAIDAAFDAHSIPYDTIWLDVEYAIAKQYFTWQPDKFPNPARMARALDRTGRNLVVIIDPHLKTGYVVAEELTKAQLTINDRGNNTYKGHCWPGESVWIDTLNPQAQPFWTSKYEAFLSNYTTHNVHVWNDMNEPSVFNGPETTSPKDNLHSGGWEHRSIHNVYGLTLHEATHNARRALDSNRRPFILTRSFYAGSQRTAAMWFGDNISSWSHLKVSVPMVLTSNIVGMSFSGADIGGFFGDPSPELLVRWYQVGIFYPFSRAHAHLDTRRREPWVAGGDATDAMRDALRLRYRMLPVWYTAFRSAHTSGAPVVRPVWYDTDDVDAYEIEDQFFVGESGIMAKPVTDEGATSVKMYIPTDTKYVDFTSGSFGDKVKVYEPGSTVKIDAPLASVPMVVRTGSAFFLKPWARRSSRLMARDPYSLTVVLDDKHQAQGKLYVDDGETYDFEDGKYMSLTVEAIPGVIDVSHQSDGIYDSTYPEQLDYLKLDHVLVISAQGFADVEKVEVATAHGRTTVPFTVSADKKQLRVEASVPINEPFAVEYSRGVAKDEL
ncbi:glucosidase 2 subunit alpha [Diutina catenulata]